MSADSDTIRSAAADATVAPLDLLLTDAAVGILRRANPGGSGLRLAAALASLPRLVAGRGAGLLGELARIAVGSSEVQPCGATAGSPTRDGRAIRSCAARCRRTWPPRRPRRASWPRLAWTRPTPNASASC